MTKKTVKDYTDFAVEKACELLAINSPSGYTDEAADWLIKEFKELGYKAKKTVKGGVTVDLGGKNDKDGLLIMAHFDTLGGMVFNQLTTIPKDGSHPEVDLYGLHILVEKLEDHRIETALVSKTDIAEESEEPSGETEAEAD